MWSLLRSFFRYRLRFALSLVIFTILILFFLFLLMSNRWVTLQIAEIKNQQENREIAVLIENRNLWEEVQSIPYIVDIYDSKMIPGSIYAYVTVDQIEHVTFVVDTLRDMGLQPELRNTTQLSELETYQQLEVFFRIFLICYIVVFFIVFVIEVKLFFSWDHRQLFLLKTLGYSNGYLCGYTVLKLFIVILLASVVAYGTFEVVTLCFRWTHSAMIFFLPILSMTFIFLLEIPILYHKIKKIEITSIFE